MKHTLKIFALTLLLTVGIMAQKGESCCCNPDLVKVSGHITPLDKTSATMLYRQNVRVMVVQIYNFTNINSYAIPVDAEGNYGTTLATCYDYVIQPMVTRRGLTRQGGTVFFENQPSYVLIRLQESRDDLVHEMTFQPDATVDLSVLPY